MSFSKMFMPPETSTTRSQREVELRLLQFLRNYHTEVDELWSTHPEAEPMEDEGDVEKHCNDSPCHQSHISDDTLRLHRELHANYLRDRFLCLPDFTQGLYSAQPWLAYWALQAADVLDITEELYEHVSPDAIGEFLLACLREVNIDGSIHYSNKVVCDRSGDDDDDGKRLMGFAGGRVAQLPHLAASYAAVCSLCILSRTVYLHAIPRAAIKRWILSLRCDDGSFRMHAGGEADIRASYCVAVMTALLQLDDVSAYVDGRDETVLTKETAAFVASHQTHEGGFACALHATEAHGAYTQCGLAALILMRQPHLCKYASLRRWLSSRQLKFEGGFNGRTNKLVDSCYSHWVGASHMLMQVGETYMRLLGQTKAAQYLTAREALLLDHAQLTDTTCMQPVDEEAWHHAEETRRQRSANVDAFLQAPSSYTFPPVSSSYSFLDEDIGDMLFNQRRLLLYVLSCCQDDELGGLMDKPECHSDAYHTCYSLSGLSTAQNLQYMPRSCATGDNVYATALRCDYIPTERDDYGIVLATKNNNNNNKSAGGSLNRSQERLCSVNPIFNIRQRRVVAVLRTWGVKSFMY